ncbi:MAG TPA: hypothetical protein PKY59_00410 [Pyrinomonadaceae bacterium]|nr:hypothetical protein [Pyrinomonadaceae bacterium]
MEKQNDVMAILKLYELRRDAQMREARQWFFTEFAPETAMDIIALFRGGERASANFRMITSYWDMACSFVLNGGIDEKMFFDSGTEHIFVYSKIQPFLAEVRQIFHEPEFLLNLETLTMKAPNIEAKIESRKRLSALWNKNPKAVSADESN